MVAGPRTIELKNDDGVMILKKLSIEEISTTLFLLPIKRGFDEGPTNVQLLPTIGANVTERDRALYGIQVSDAGDTSHLYTYAHINK